MGTTNTTPWLDLKAESQAAMTPEDRAEYDAAAAEAELRLQLAELVYDACRQRDSLRASWLGGWEPPKV